MVVGREGEEGIEQEELGDKTRGDQKGQGEGQPSGALASSMLQTARMLFAVPRSTGSA